jgi:hypothetical protein
MLTRTKIERNKRIKATVKAAGISSLIALFVFMVLEIFGLHDFSKVSIFVFCFATFALITRYTRNDRFILWLRHFQPRNSRKLRFGILLFFCSDLFIPITLRDSSYSRSIGSAIIRFFTCSIFLSAVAALPLSLLFLIPVIYVSASFDLISEKTILPIIIVGFLLGFIPVITYLYFKKRVHGIAGSYLLSIASCLSEVDLILSKTLQRAYPWSDSVIIQCPDEVWQEVVTFVIERSSIVLIDVSELTDNVIWEIQTLLIKKKLNRIIVANGIKAGDLEQLPPLTSEILQAIVGEDQLRQIRKFYYPIEHPRIGWKSIKLYWKLLTKLREELLSFDCELSESVEIQRQE